MEFADCVVEAWTEQYPLKGEFRISRGAKTEAEVVACRVTAQGKSGIGECVPYARYGETIESVLGQISTAIDAFGGNFGHESLLTGMAAGAARNAVDAALWDLQAKLSGEHAHQKACRLPPRPVETAYTISLSDADTMADAARAASHRPVLKIKLGGTNDIAAMHAVVSAAPRSRIIIDANEGWHRDNLRELMSEAARLHISLIEQPLPADDDWMLAECPHPVPVCADESAHTTDDLESLGGRYDAVNIKLDKTGGLTEALRMRDRARELGFGIMVGCMVGTSLSMAPAVLLAQDADYIDLDGPLLLARDRVPPLRYTGSIVAPPMPALWG